MKLTKIQLLHES